MRKRATIVLLVAAGALMSVWLGLRMRRNEQTDDLLRSAERLLHPTLVQVASVRDVRAREAHELLDEALELQPSVRADDLLLEARVIEQLQRGNPSKAEQLLATQSAKRQQVPALLQLSAAVALEHKDAIGAAAWLDKLPATLREQPAALALASDVARALGRADEALRLAQRGLALEPEAAALHERSGLAFELLGEQARARAELERAVALDRRGSSALFALGRLLREQGELQGAMLAFHEATQRNPNDAEAWLASGVCRTALGDRVAARIELETAATLANTRAEPLLALADLDVADGNLGAALGRYRAAVLLDPSAAIGKLKLGNTLLRTGAVSDAIPVFRQALQQRPDLAAVHNGLGAALLAHGELPEAEDALKTATRLDPADANPWLNLARLYRRRGDASLLANALAQAEERSPQRSARR
jgi:tetratricopeptide (TPR) repeat protein